MTTQNPFSNHFRTPSHLTISDDGAHLTPISAEVAQLQHEMHSLDQALDFDAQGEMMRPLEEDEMKPFDDVDLGRVDRQSFSRRGR